MSGDDPNVGEDRAVTTEPAMVRELLERYDAYPAHLRQSEGTGDQGLLRLAFADDGEDAVGDDDGGPDEDLKRISWAEFREEFEEKRLALVYPEGLPADGRDELALVRREDA